MGNIRIALADDHSLFRKGMHRIIDDANGLEVLFDVADGEELMQRLQDEQPDVILMDLNMPGLNGIDATAQIHKLYPGVKILILSIYNEERFIVRMIEQGADGYLFKNAEIEEVEKAIRDVVYNGFYFNEQMMKALRKAPAVKGAKLSFSLAVNLTQRELDVLELICKEFTAAEIAEQLYISVRTVDGHRQNLLDKTGARNTAGLVVYAVKNKLIDLGF